MSDEWVTVQPSRKTARNGHWAVFYGNSMARIPGGEGCEFGDWQVSLKNPSQVRFLFHDAGRVAVRRYDYHSSASVRVSTGPLQRQLGTKLKGTWPCRVEGNATIIDLSEVNS